MFFFPKNKSITRLIRTVIGTFQKYDIQQLSSSGHTTAVTLLTFTLINESVNPPAIIRNQTVFESEQMKEQKSTLSFTSCFKYLSSFDFSKPSADELSFNCESKFCSWNAKYLVQPQQLRIFLPQHYKLILLLTTFWFEALTLTWGDTYTKKVF